MINEPAFSSQDNVCVRLEFGFSRAVGVDVDLQGCDDPPHPQ
jgi:hypothetical protein